MEYDYATDETLGRRGIFNPLLLAVAIALAEATKLDPLDLLASSSEPSGYAPEFASPLMAEPSPSAYYELSVA